MSIQIPEERMEAWRAFLQAHAAVIRTLEREMQEEQGLPLTWYEILVWLDHAPEGRLRMQDLADSVLLSRSGLTRLMDRMTEAGLVTREACSYDRRGMNAVITPEGRAALERSAPGHLRGVQEHFLRHLDDADVQAMRRALSKVLASEKGEASGDCGD
jgi:DNA-binding MarR family transcriptional regulator